MIDEVKLPELELVALGEELTCEHAAYRTFISHGPSKYCCYICYLLRENDAALRERDALQARVKVLEDALTDCILELSAHEGDSDSVKVFRARIALAPCVEGHGGQE
jgi:hypothetical protein